MLLQFDSISSDLAPPQQFEMLAKLAPRFVIRGVIQNAYYANYMCVELCKQIIGESNESFAFKDPKHFYECNFYGYLSQQPKPTEFIDQFEAQKYDQAVNKFTVYNEVKVICDSLNEFTLELRELYKVVETNNTSSNFFSRSKQADEVWQEDLHDAVDRYHNLLEKLEAYPEWKDKMVEEVGRWFLMIHNNLAEGDAKRELFSKLNRQDYFV